MTAPEHYRKEQPPSTSRRRLGQHPLTLEYIDYDAIGRAKPVVIPVIKINRGTPEPCEVVLNAPYGRGRPGECIKVKLPWTPSPWYLQHMREQFRSVWK